MLLDGSIDIFEGGWIGTSSDIPSRTVLLRNCPAQQEQVKFYIHHFDDIRDAIEVVLGAVREKNQTGLALGLENSDPQLSISKWVNFSSIFNGIHVPTQGPKPLIFPLNNKITVRHMNQITLVTSEASFVCGPSSSEFFLNQETADVFNHCKIKELPSAALMITVQAKTLTILETFEDSTVPYILTVPFDVVQPAFDETKRFLESFGPIIAFSEPKRSLLTGSTFKFFCEFYRLQDCERFLDCRTRGKSLHLKDVEVSFESVNLYNVDREDLFFSTFNKLPPVSFEQANISRSESLFGCNRSTGDPGDQISSESSISFSSIEGLPLSNSQNQLQYRSNYLQDSIHQNSIFPALHRPNTIVEADFEIDLTQLERGLEGRTTCMIRNIPNKYTQQMVLDLVNEGHRGCFDFLYLRMDFRNRCNVGYAFINFTHPRHIVSFSQRINGKRWAHFNSEKVCNLTFARIQGIQALVDKFRSSKVMSEAPAYRPKLFFVDGPLAGQESPFPS